MLNALAKERSEREHREQLGIASRFVDATVTNQHAANVAVLRPMTELRPAPLPSGFYASAKRTIDVLASLAALILFFPLICVFAILVFVTDPGPIFYAQNRVGRDGKTFRCWKIRSMAVDADELLKALLREDSSARREWAATRKLRYDPRVTTIGRVMRITSVDELPQLFNILRGDMSLVGPRPITNSEISFYGHRFTTYCSVQPGLTGLWQVSGRSETTYRRRVALDVAYARNRTLVLDAIIIMRTIPALAGGRGSW